jgi:hypothetical protein
VRKSTNIATEERRKYGYGLGMCGSLLNEDTRMQARLEVEMVDAIVGHRQGGKEFVQAL